MVLGGSGSCVLGTQDADQGPHDHELLKVPSGSAGLCPRDEPSRAPAIVLDSGPSRHGCTPPTLALSLPPLPWGPAMPPAAFLDLPPHQAQAP